MYQRDGWSLEKGTVTSPVNITVNVPSMQCLVALVGRRHGFNFVLYNNLTSATQPFFMKAYNLTYYQVFPGAVVQSGWITFEGPFGFDYYDLFPELPDGLDVQLDLTSQWVIDRHPFIVGIFMPISLWTNGVPMVSNEFYANSFSSNLINFEF